MEERGSPHGHTKGGDPPYIFAKLPLAPRTSSHYYTTNVEESQSSRPYPIAGATAGELEE
jgi:hypothetical protein